MKQLARRGFLSRHRVSVALLVPEAPLVNWSPDLPEAVCVPGENWIGKDASRLFLQPKARIKVPDALIVDDYQTRRVIELGGLYGPRRLKGFHRQRASRRTPYEIW